MLAIMTNFLASNTLALTNFCFYIRVYPPRLGFSRLRCHAYLPHIINSNACRVGQALKYYKKEALIIALYYYIALRRLLQSHFLSAIFHLNYIDAA